MLSFDNSVSVLSYVGLTLVSGALVSILSYSHNSNYNNKCCTNDNCSDTTKCNDLIFKNPCPVGRVSRGALLTGIVSIGASNLLSVVSSLRA
uniref:Uncharacterized protein n=1 Tax=viral metagenome TaxID=1070528 RepID=A0A6C0J636_9ZZZZ